MENVIIKALKPNEVSEFTELIKLFEEVFQMKNFELPDKCHLDKILKGESFKVFVAEINDKIVGGATVFVLEQYYSTKPLAYIYDLAVKVEFQRRGIGRKVIEFINAFFLQKGFEEVFVQADEVDDYALDFYRSTHPTSEEKVRHFYYRFY